jgi:hypothetical protein
VLGGGLTSLGREVVAIEELDGTMGASGWADDGDRVCDFGDDDGLA